MDIDVQAVTATRQNATHNGVDDRLIVTAGADSIVGEFDVVVANILAGPLAKLAARICGHLTAGGLLALSGILASQVDDVLDAYRRWVDFDAPRLRSQGGQTWTRLTGRKRQS